MCLFVLYLFIVVAIDYQWGLLITFIELIKNPKYGFWTKSFTSSAPEIEKVLESIAKSCIGPSAASVIQQQKATASSGDSGSISGDAAANAAVSK